MPCPFQIFSQSDSLILIVDINSHAKWQMVQIQISWLLRLLRSQLIWIYTVCKGSIYPGSAGQGLIKFFLAISCIYYIFYLLPYRFGGGEFPPMIFFKVFLHSEGKGVKYLSGKRVIKPATDVSRFAKSFVVS